MLGSPFLGWRILMHKPLRYHLEESKMEHFSQFITNHWPLWLAFFGILILIYINEWFTQKRAPVSLSPQSVVEKINRENSVIFDLRDKEAFSAGHIIHAIRASAEDFTQPRMAKYKTKSLILVCTKGIHSQSLASKLKTQGYEQVMVLAGGLTAWQNAELPLVKGHK
jgi:rhodanese-related sulfurtransferase